MRIARDGTWFYQGTPIGREGLVRLFSSIIKKEGDDYFLVTPVEKVGIVVEDAPFVAIDFQETADGLLFETNVGDRALAGPDHAIRIARDGPEGEPSPYIHIRANLEALIDRKSFYRLIDIGEHRDVDGTEWFGIASGDSFFRVMASADLKAASA